MKLKGNSRWDQGLETQLWYNNVVDHNLYNTLYVFTLILEKCLRDWNIKVYGYGIEITRRMENKEKKNLQFNSIFNFWGFFFLSLDCYSMATIQTMLCIKHKNTHIKY